MTSPPEVAVVLVRGGWHDHSPWDKVTQMLRALIAKVDSAGGGKTITHTVGSNHSLFLSQPAASSVILVDIGIRSLAAQRAEALQV